MNKNSTSRAINILKGVACMTAVIFHSFMFIYQYLVPKQYTVFFIAETIVSPSLLFFIIITGYYSFNIDEKKLKNRIIKLFKLLLCCIVFYTIFMMIYTFYVAGKVDFIKLIDYYFSFNAIISAILYCDFPLWIPGWYLVAIIETYLFYYLFLKFNKANQLLKFTYILLILGTGFYIYSNVYLSRVGQNTFFVRALPNFLLGMKIREKQEKNNFNTSNVVLMLLLILGLIIGILPYFLKCPIKMVVIGDAIIGPTIFVLIVKNSDKIHSRLLELIGSRYSGMIYIYHMFVLILLPGVLRRIGIYMEGITFVFFPLLGVLLTLLISIVLYSIKSKFKKVIV